MIHKYQGEQWVASLHIWNRPKPRDENNLDGVEDSITVSASFESKDVVYAFLYWEDQVRKVLKASCFLFIFS